MADPAAEHATHAMDETTEPTNATIARAGPAPRNPVHEWLLRLYLEYVYQRDTLSITVQEFLCMLETTSTNPSRSWLSEDQITLPMVLQLQGKTNRSDMVVVPPSAASLLASIGLGIVESESFTSQAPGLLGAMTKTNVRWIVIPCNDGMIQVVDAVDRYNKAQKTAAENAREKRDESEAPQHARATRSATAARQAEEKQTKERDVPSTVITATKKSSQPHNIPPNPAGHATAHLGMHWGMIVIDKEIDDARFFDGDLKRVIIRKNGAEETFIRSRWNTATAAGKVLCGYDVIMRRQKGLFKTGTLRHVPHDHWDNKYKGDKGSSCAPWVFAMFRYILQNPTFLTDKGGLKGTFAQGQKQRHVNDLGFNSEIVRHDMQSLIAEQARKSEATIALPHKLNTMILQSLNAITPEELLHHLNNPNRRYLTHRRGAIFPSGGGSKSDNSDDEDGDEWPSDYEGIPFADFQNHIPTDPGLTKEQRLRHAYDIYVATQRSLEEGLKEQNVNNQNATKGTNDNNETDRVVGSKSDPRYAVLPESAAFRAVANQTIDFTSMDEQHLDEWFKKISTQGFLNSNTSRWHRKLSLQKAFGGIDASTINKEAAAEYRIHLRMDTNWGQMQVIERLNELTENIPDLRGQVQRYPDFYLRDRGIMPTNENNKHDKHTGSNKRKRRDTGSGKKGASRKTCPDDTTHKNQNSADSQGSESEDYTQSYQTANKSGGKLSRNKGSTPRNKDPNDRNGDIDHQSRPATDNTSDDNASSTAPWDNPHEMPLGVLDFRTMPADQLEQHKSPEMLADHRLRNRNVNIISWRAFLFATVSGRHFSEESDENCLKIWLKDSIVFTEQERTIDWGKLNMINTIRERMNTHYYTAPPTEIADNIADLSDTERDSDGKRQSSSESNSVSPNDRNGAESNSNSNSNSNKRRRSLEESNSKDHENARKKPKTSDEVCIKRPQRTD